MRRRRLLTQMVGLSVGVPFLFVVGLRRRFDCWLTHSLRTAWAAVPTIRTRCLWSARSSPRISGPPIIARGNAERFDGLQCVSAMLVSIALSNVA